MDEVEYLTLEWVVWFNNRFILEPNGIIPPAEYELMHYQQLEESTEAAWLTQKSLRLTRAIQPDIADDVWAC